MQTTLEEEILIAHVLSTPKSKVKTLEAVSNARTMHLHYVYDAADYPHNVIKPGNNKTGTFVTDGPWGGMPLFALTLEERATCPLTCEHFVDCYGNATYRGHRFIFNEALLERVETEIASLARRYRHGFVVRLHILGDFSTVEYVKFWAELVKKHENLHVFGYTHMREDDPIPNNAAIGSEIIEQFNDRFFIRASDYTGEYNIPRAYTEHLISQAKRKDVFVCLEQAGVKDNCGECRLCWESTKSVVFLDHTVTNKASKKHTTKEPYMMQNGKIGHKKIFDLQGYRKEIRPYIANLMKTAQV